MVKYFFCSKPEILKTENFTENDSAMHATFELVAKTTLSIVKVG